MIKDCRLAPFGIPPFFHWALSCLDLRMNSYGLSTHVLSLRVEPCLELDTEPCLVHGCSSVHLAHVLLQICVWQDIPTERSRHPRNACQERLHFRSQHVCKQKLKTKDVCAFSGGHLFFCGYTADQHKAEEVRARHSAAHRRKQHKMLGRQFSHTGTTASPRCILTALQRPQHMHHRVHEAGVGKSLA